MADSPGRTHLASALLIFLVILAQQRPILSSKPWLKITPEFETMLIGYQEVGQGPTCQSQGESPNLFSHIRWSGPNQMDNHEYLMKRHQIYPKENNRMSKLKFVKPTSADAGRYYCQSKYQGNDVLLANITVEFFDPISFTDCPMRQAIVKGGTSEKIKCKITGDSPQVTITKDGVDLKDMTSRYHTSGNDGAIEIIGPVTEDDAGVYKIDASSGKDGKSNLRDIQVEIHSEPVIMANPDSSLEAANRGVEDGSATLWCNAVGNPKPLVYWTNPRRDNMTREAEHYIEVPEEGKLIIKKIRASHDNGTFECKAVNDVGFVSRGVNFSVLTRPKIQMFSNVTADENSEFTMECRSTGHPQPQISIRRHGIGQQPYSYGDNYTRGIDYQMEGGGGIPVYVYRVRLNASRSLVGEHFCNASSREAGSDETRSFVFVNYRPDVSRNQYEQFVQAGRNFSLTCRVEAYPSPQIFWYQDNIQIVNATSMTQVSPDGQLHISTMQPNNIQQAVNSYFTCRAENKMGSSEIRIKPRYTTLPGLVFTEILETKPTRVRFRFVVPNDGGDPIRHFIYSIRGTSLDLNNPHFIRREDIRGETSLNIPPPYNYTMLNLLPGYNYNLRIRAVNVHGAGDEETKSFITARPEKPDMPTIRKPSSRSISVASPYRNGYQLEWSEPQFDNGDPINKYIIDYFPVKESPLGILLEDGPKRSTEVLPGKPLTIRIGPLAANQRYRIELRAANTIGLSDADHLIITTSNNQPSMPEFEGQTLQWLVEPSTPFLIIFLILMICTAITIDLIFYSRQVGITYSIRSVLCAKKTTSVIDDKQAYNKEDSA